MSKQLPQHLADFAAKYKLTADDVWQIPGSSNFAAKHKALERVAAAEKITFEPPLIISSNYSGEGIAICVTGRKTSGPLGTSPPPVIVTEWSIGEASPLNYSDRSESQKMKLYPWAMAEKRAKDRVILKLVGLHGDLYSEDEIASSEDEIDNGHKANGGETFNVSNLQVDDITGEITETVTTPKKLRKDQRTDWLTMDKEMRTHMNLTDLEEWEKGSRAERDLHSMSDQMHLFKRYLLHGFAIAESPAALHEFRSDYDKIIKKYSVDNQTDIDAHYSEALAKFNSPLKQQLKDSLAENFTL